MTLYDDESIAMVAYHKGCFANIANPLHAYLNWSCSSCGIDIDLSKDNHMSSRVLYDDAHDLEVTCRTCILTDVEIGKLDDTYEIDIRLARGSKR